MSATTVTDATREQVMRLPSGHEVELPAWSPALDRDHAQARARLEPLVGEEGWRELAPWIAAIRRLARERDAIILAHNYMTPDIYHGIADVVGDSLELARRASRLDASVVIQCGVYFMAETTKLLAPDKRVVIPDPEAGCSLAASITAEDVRELRHRHPGVPIVAYVNTTAAVKAEVDVCCTSANARRIVEALGAPRVLLVPDRYLAANVAAETGVEILTWPGRCEVHERFGVAELRALRRAEPEMAVLAHPECRPEVIAEADFSGSTAAMARWIDQHRPERALLVTECSMSDNLAASFPEVRFVRSCHLCPHMKRIVLEKVLQSLLTLEPEVTVPDDVAPRARRAIERMFELAP